MKEFLDTVELSGITQEHIIEIERFIRKYINFMDGIIDKTKSITYFKKMMDNYSLAYYIKQMYQIRRFLLYLNVDWIKEIKLPADPVYAPKRVTLENIQQTLKYFEKHEYHLQIKALILLGCNSGMRAEELYQLTKNDIDLENKTVRINHDPQNKQSTKTKRSRTSFFTEETKQALVEYYKFFDKNKYLKCLWNQSHVERIFRDAPIRVKELRKAFSQQWDRRGGQTSIKKLLMGHSTRNDVDLQHYNGQNDDDLKQIYEKIMGELVIAPSPTELPIVVISD